MNPADGVASQRTENEWTVIQQAVAGDAAAQEGLFSRHTSRLFKAAFRVLRNKEDAEDALQDGLCKAFTCLRSFQGRSSFATWLTRIVMNSALMLRRSKHAHLEASLDELLESQPKKLPQGAIDPRPSPEEICAAAEIEELVQAQVNELPQLLQHAFRARQTSHLSGVQSSRAMGIPVSAFKSRIYRARRKLASGLRRSLGSRAAPLAVGA